MRNHSDDENLILRDFLNKIIWDTREDPEDYELLFIHRGAPGDVKRISMSSIVKVARSWFVYLDLGSEQFIPLHRVLKVINRRTGDTLWSKSS